jgi:hypothetical protein
VIKGIKGINLTALRYQRFSIGDAIFEAGDYGPWRFVFEVLIFKEMESGEIKVGDSVVLINPLRLGGG